MISMHFNMIKILIHFNMVMILIHFKRYQYILQFNRFFILNDDILAFRPHSFAFIFSIYLLFIYLLFVFIFFFVSTYPVQYLFLFSIYLVFTFSFCFVGHMNIVIQNHYNFPIKITSVIIPEADDQPGKIRK